MKVMDILKKTHLSQSFTFGSRHLHEDEDLDMGDSIYSNVAPEQKKSHVSYYESQGHN